MTDQQSRTSDQAEAEHIVRTAYALILGRPADMAGLSNFSQQLVAGVLSPDDLYRTLAISEEFKARVGGGHPVISDQRQEVQPGQIDVRRLIADSDLAEHHIRAEQYFRDHADELDHFLSMPYGSIDESIAQLGTTSQLLALTRPLPGMRVMDFGAGTCWLTRLLTQLHCEVVAVDASESALEVGRLLFKRLPPIGEVPSPTFLHFDGRHLDLPDESVERIICMDAFHHVPNQGEVLREWYRVLSDGGIVAMAEPGAHHSLDPQAQHEMRHYGVIENDVLLSEIEPLARAAGFADFQVAVPSPPPVLLPAQEYLQLVSPLPLPAAFTTKLREVSVNAYKIVLFKGERRPPDSREPLGLACDLAIRLASPAVRAGEPITVTYRAANTGRNVWLHSGLGIGTVALGVHIVRSDGQFVKTVIIPLIRGASTPPSTTIDGTVSLEGLPTGTYDLRFDLVVPQVAWFATSSGHTTDVGVDVV